MLTIKLLGEPLIFLDEELVSGFISNKSRALFIYLLSQGEMSQRGLLASLFWPEMEEGRARKNLTKAISNLRRLFPDHLDADATRAGVQGRERDFFDVAKFEALVEKGVADQELKSLEQARKLYRGDFLDGFSVGASPEFYDWVQTRRVQLRSLCIEALALLGRLKADRESWDDALQTNRELLVLDPYRESAHRQLMTLLARQGRRAEALQQFEICAAALAEVGATPDPETRALFQRLQRASEPPAHHLPQRAGQLVGRQQELERIRTILLDPGCRLLTITGAGGCGKTHLALEAAHGFAVDDSDWHSRYTDGVRYISMTTVTSAESILPALADGLELRSADGAVGRSELFDYLRQRRMLLLLDNFEQVLDGVDLLLSILDSAPALQILVTSRVRLNVRGEYVVRLRGLPWPEWEIPLEAVGEKTVAEIGEYGAVQLFVESARRLSADFRLSTVNAPAITRICSLVEGMPLGLLLAASWIELLTPDEIAAEIERSYDFLEGEMRDAPQRQRSIRAVFNSSWALLTPREQSVLAQLSVFRGSFSRSAAQIVAQASLRDLKNLTQKSLLYRNQDERFAVHELVRQYAGEKLNEQVDGGNECRDRHSAFYTSILRQWADELEGARQLDLLAEIIDDAENVRSAWRWACARGNQSRLNEMCEGLGHFHLWLGRHQEGAEAFGEATRLLEAISADPFLLAKCIMWQGILGRFTLPYADADRLLERSLRMLSALGAAGHDVARERALVLLQMGELEREFDREKAEAHFKESLTLYRSVDDDWGVANALSSLGWLIQHYGEYQEAQRIYAESLEIRTRLHDRSGIAGSEMLLATIALYQGRHEEAERRIRISAALNQELGNQAGIARSLSRLGETLTWLGRFDEAIEPLRQSHEIYAHLGMRDNGSFAQAMLAVVWMHQGKLDQARESLKPACEYFQHSGARRGIAYCFLISGWVSLAERKSQEAESALEEALALYRQIGQLDEAGQALALLGHVAMEKGDAARAEDRLEQSLQIAKNLRAFMPTMLTLTGLSLLAQSQGDVDQARSLRRLGRNHPFVANSRWVNPPGEKEPDPKDLSLDPGDAWQKIARILLDQE